MKLFSLIIIALVPLVSAPATALPSSATSAGTKRALVAVNELYSETNYRSDVEGVATQTRLRHQSNLRLLPASLQAYVGVSVDRSLLESNEGSRLIENSVSPQIGVVYRPFSFLNIWSEYRLRIRERTEFDQKTRTENDPRFGIAAGYRLLPRESALNAEAYAELVSVPRLAGRPVVSGHLRGFARAGLNGFTHLDLYSELNEYQSPDPAFGPTRQSLRAGARLALEGSFPWSAGLYAYRPWLIERGGLRAQDFEALLAVGGVF